MVYGIDITIVVEIIYNYSIYIYMVYGYDMGVSENVVYP